MQTSLDRDYYSVLGVAREASAKDIKKRFRELVRERHPDRFRGEAKEQAERDFQDITEALNILMDPVRRRQLDMRLAQPRRGQHQVSDLLRVYLNRGIRSYKEGNWIEAANNFDRATQADPQSAQAWHHLALTCSRETRWMKKAQEAILRALELRPEHVPYLKLAGKVFAASGMTPRAKQYYNQALKIGGANAAVKKALLELSGGVGSPSSAGSGGNR